MRLFCPRRGEKFKLILVQFLFQLAFAFILRPSDGMKSSPTLVLSADSSNELGEGKCLFVRICTTFQV
jgi:hypothetical protein